MTITTNDGAPVTAVPEHVADTHDEEQPDPEVPERAQRRTFTAKYKLQMLAYDAAEAGAQGALLRREGSFSGRDGYTDENKRSMMLTRRRGEESKT